MVRLFADASYGVHVDGKSHHTQFYLFVLHIYVIASTDLHPRGVLEFHW